MKINEISIYYVKMPLIEPWKTAYGEQSETESVFVNLVTDGGSGWGECTPAPQPLYNPEFTSGAFEVLKQFLLPEVIGKTISSGEVLQQKLARFKGNKFAKSALDCAWWDAFAQTQGKPLWRVIGGSNQTVDVGADLPILANNEKLMERVKDAVDSGFKRIKLKFGKGNSVEALESIRENFPDLVFHIDCNSGFTLEDLPFFERIDGLGLAMIEQPLAFDDLIDHATLQSKINTPICLDESVTSLHRVRKAVEIGACQWVNIKTSRVGGLTNAISIHDFCAEKGIPVWVGGMLESTTGQGASLALATLSNVQYPSDIFPSNRFYTEDLSTPEIKLSSPPCVTAPECPGVGFSPRDEAIQSASIKEFSITI